MSYINIKGPSKGFSVAVSNNQLYLNTLKAVFADATTLSYKNEHGVECIVQDKDGVLQLIDGIDEYSAFFPINKSILFSLYSVI